MVKFLFVFTTLIIFNCNCLFSQNTIIGTIKNTNNLPLPFVNIYLSKKSIVTISNTEGIFKFSFPNGSIEDTLVFSYIGYKTKKILVNETLKLKELNIVLEPSTYLLNEVVVSNKVLTAAEILKQARKKYYSNYIPSQDYNANMYFREYVKENDNYVRAKEAAIKTYSKANNEHVQFKVQKCRFAASLQNSTLNKGDLGLGYIFQFSWLSNNNISYFKGKLKNTKKDTIIFYHNKLVYVLSNIRGSKGEELKNLYLSNIGNDYAFYNSIKNSTEKYGFNIYIVSVDDLKIEKIFSYFNFGDLKRIKYHSTGEFVALYNTISSIEFIERNNKMYPYHLFYFNKSYISNILHKPILKHSYNELINNEIINNNVEIIPEEYFSKAIDEFYFNNDCKNDDPEFWKNYNYLPDDKLKQQVLESIEKQRNK